MKEVELLEEKENEGGVVGGVFWWVW